MWSRRTILTLFTVFPGLLAKEAGKVVERGTLVIREDGSPALETTPGKRIPLSGDKPTMGVLTDPRLKGATVEVHGQPAEGGGIRLGPIHKNALFVVKNGKKSTVSYWCDVCSIRTYTPGVCMCCQADTELDLQEHHEH
jgi:hypothetical protein